MCLQGAYDLVTVHGFMLPIPLLPVKALVNSTICGIRTKCSQFDSTIMMGMNNPAASMRSGRVSLVSRLHCLGTISRCETAFASYGLMSAPDTALTTRLPSLIGNSTLHISALPPRRHIPDMLVTDDVKQVARSLVWPRR
jgi:hypothetical protein